MKRNYESNNSTIKNIYKEQRKHQTTSFVQYCIDKYCKFENKAPFWTLFRYLTEFTDLSDPDITLTNEQHLYQTAEALRRDDMPEWLVLTGFIHDLGKIIYKKGSAEDGTSLDTQWAIVGDTFVVDEPIPKCVPYPELNTERKSSNNPQCGLDQLICSFGHDEYLYRLLKHNCIDLPESSLYIIRYHSLYPWHSGNAYTIFENEKDRSMKPWVQIFQQYDLYSKENTPVDVNEVQPYYKTLIAKYFKKDIEW